MPTHELQPAELRRDFKKEIKFDTTAELAPYDDIIGQERAKDALTFGLSVKAAGYNIFALGETSYGKTTFAEKFALKFAKDEPAPNDICYVYNFLNPKKPRLLSLGAGQGVILEREMNDLVDTLKFELPKIFEHKDMDDVKSGIIKYYSRKKDDIIKIMSDEAKQQNFGIKTTGTGIYFMPIVDGEIISEEAYDDLTEEQKNEINQNSDAISASAFTTMRSIREWEKSTKREISEFEYQTALFAVGKHMEYLFIKYKDAADVLRYLKDVKEDILENIADFTEPEEDDELQAFPWSPQKKDDDEIFTKYRINVLTDNTGVTSAPVLIEHNLSYSNFVGEVEYDNEYGNLSTDFMNIKAGTFHKANGGYLILDAAEVLNSYQAWEALRLMLKTQKVTIEPLRALSTGIAISGITPEPMEVSVKVIMVGSYYHYEVLSEYEQDFCKFFKVCADFDMDMKADNISKILGFIKKTVLDGGFPELDASACSALLYYSSREADDQNKFDASLGKIRDIITEAAQLGKAALITEKHINAAIRARVYRKNMYEDKLSDMIRENMILIDTSGKKTGTINGLCVIDMEDYIFGKPAKITATSYVGKSGIVNIEKEAEMSGSIHDKGIQVLIGYLGHTYAQDFPLSLSCRICFEQNYNGIDGDSASSTELYVVLSSLSGLPISQEIAVTGSINQFGDIQPIGGVTQKIEGFFDLCRERGFTGEQGVIIPRANTRNLVLKDEVVNAVSEGVFHIYPINHVDEGIQILTGVPAGEKNEKGKFPSDTVHGMVFRRLKEFHKKSLSEE
ncbi:ATP-dependent protease [Clostridia bacterium]|nr:ATP-dependent protease [Clostridia bacterium]